MVFSASSTLSDTGASTCTTASAFTGFAPAPLAAQREVGDVHALLAQDGSDLPDHARHIEVAADQQIAFERRLNIDAVELQQPRLLAVNHGCAGAAFALRCVQLDGQHGGRAAAMALLLLLVHANAALLRPPPPR